jgi:hypothetical protein
MFSRGLAIPYFRFPSVDDEIVDCCSNGCTMVATKKYYEKMYVFFEHLFEFWNHDGKQY